MDLVIVRENTEGFYSDRNMFAGSGEFMPDPDMALSVRKITAAAGALLILDEIQTGIGRTGEWFAFQAAGITPDAMTLAKGLGGGVPVGALVTFGPEVTGLLTAGQHGSTFGGNPLAAAAGLAVLETIEREGLLAHTRTLGEHLHRRVSALDLPHIAGIRGVGLLQAILLADPIAADLAVVARHAGFIVNPVAPRALRLAPPLIVSAAELDSFVDALPMLLESFPDPSPRSTP
jgi:acetylornithine aminotransferase